MRRILWLAPLLILLAVPLALRAEPEDLAEKMRQVEELMRLLEEADLAEEGPEFAFEEENPPVIRVYNVADLTVRLTNFIAPNLLLKPAGAEIDESQPLFGKAEEGEIFFAGPEELMDLVVMNVRPDSWDDDGMAINVTGPFGLIVLALPEVQEEVAAYIEGLRQSVGRLITVEARLLRTLERGSSRLPAGRTTAILNSRQGLDLIRAAERGEKFSLVHSARLQGFNGQRVSMHSGSQRSFIQDYDVEVAQESSIADPIVGVLQSGLTLDLRSFARGEDLVIVDLQSQFAQPALPMRILETASGPVHAPRQEMVLFSTSVTIPDGGYALIAGGGRHQEEWTLLLSAKIERVSSPQKGGAK